jgi:hypothetical protein
VFLLPQLPLERMPSSLPAISSFGESFATLAARFFDKQ